MTRITVSTSRCRRCGKLIAGLNRSLLGLDNLKARLGGICQDCATPAEKQELTMATLEAAINRLQKQGGE